MDAGSSRGHVCLDGSGCGGASSRSVSAAIKDSFQALRETILPPLKEGDTLRLQNVERTDHETKPPARYTEASLVQKMEKEGIGRPSTYASTIATVIDRGYVVKAGNALVPTFTAFAVNCTHLACPVNWQAQAEIFLCPCHGGVFYGDGRVAAGPPPRPLPRYDVRVQGNNVQILTRPVPIGDV